MRGQIESIGMTLDRRLRVTFDVYEGQIQPLLELKDKDLDIEIKPHREKRTKDANAYMWVLLDKLADRLRTSKEELYVKYVHDYGVFTHIICKGKAVDAVTGLFRVVDNLGEITVGGEKAVQLQCYYGTSTYDTKQMSRLIDAIIDDCKAQGIETLTPAEKGRMMAAWEKQHQ